MIASRVTIMVTCLVCSLFTVLALCAARRKVKLCPRAAETESADTAETGAES